MDYTKSNPMNGRYRETKSKKNLSRYYILLSVVFIVVLFKWGIPLFFNVLSGPDGTENNTAFADSIPPQVPMLSALSEATNSAKISVTGFTEKEVDVELLINDELVDTQKSDENGAISLEGSLTKGENRLLVNAKDSAGNTSQSPVVLITYDNSPLELILESPKDGSEYFGSNNQTVDIKGKVNKTGTTVIVNGSYSMTDKDGNFNQRILLNNGENNILIKATDKAGNLNEKTLKLIFNP